LSHNDIQKEFFGHEHLTVIEPPKGWHMLNLRELWAYRELLWVLTARDIKVRYRQTVIGATWAVLRPFLSMVIFSIVFGRMAKMPSEGFPYPVFVYSGLLPWTFFATAANASANSLVGSSHLVSKVYFPRLIIPISSVGSGLVDLLISTGVLLGLMIFYDLGWNSGLLIAPCMMLAVIVTALGIGTLLSALNVAFRDFQNLAPFLIQIWMYATPVIYPVSIFPQKWQWLLYLNPMAGLVEGIRAAFLGKPLDPMGFGVSISIALLFFVAGVTYFEKVERRFADII
jgi:lipopolysaccharide transport system permease protein